MANSTPSRPGYNAAGAAGNLNNLLDIFGGEVQASYERMTIMRDKHRIFQLKDGKSLRFPRVGRATAAYHVPGEEVLGGQIANDEIVLNSDDKLYAAAFVADIDDILTHYDYRSEYSRQLSEALAVQFDQNVMRAVIKSARAADLLGGPASAPVIAATALTDPIVLFDSLSKAKENLDTKNVRVDMVDVHGLVKTAQWYLLARSDKNLNRDYNGGSASMRNHTLETVDGIKIVKSNICPYGTNDSTNTTIPVRYRNNYATTVAAVWTPDAVGTAEVQSLSINVVAQPEKFGNLLMAYQMSGTDTFRATDAVEIKTA